MPTYSCQLYQDKKRKACAAWLGSKESIVYNAGGEIAISVSLWDISDFFLCKREKAQNREALWMKLLPFQAEYVSDPIET